MALRTCTLDSLNLNDHVSYWLLPGFSPGLNVPTYDEWRNYYSNGVAIANVSLSHVVAMSLPLKVQGGSETLVRAAIAAINTKIQGCSNASPKNLVVGLATYQIVLGVQINPDEDYLYMSDQPQIDLQFMRLPLAGGA